MSTAPVSPQQLTNYLRSQEEWRPSGRRDGMDAWATGLRRYEFLILVPKKVKSARDEDQLAGAIAMLARHEGITEDELRARLNGPAGRLDWNMSDWEPGDVVVDGIVMALEGCGDNETPVQVTALDGTPVRLLGVTRHGKAVRIVIELP